MLEGADPCLDRLAAQHPSVLDPHSPSADRKSGFPAPAEPEGRSRQCQSKWAGPRVSVLGTASVSAPFLFLLCSSELAGGPGPGARQSRDKLGASISRLGVHLNSMSFYNAEVNLRAPFAERKLAAPSEFTRRGDAAMRRVKQASRKKTHNQSRRRDGAGCGRTGSFAVR